MKLNHETFSAPGATPTEAVVFLHGILGSGGNLRSHARRFVAGAPRFLAVLMDLRAHGESQGAEGPDTVVQAARDVAETARAVGLPVTAVVGHSFGGKVALALPAELPTLRHVLTLDSAPGPRHDARGSEATVLVLSMLGDVRGPWPTRDAFVDEVVRRGQSKMLAQWLAMNLARTDAGFVVRLDLSRIEALLDDYFALDLWPVVEASAHGQGPAVHLVIGTRSKVYEHDDRVRAQGLESSSGGRVTVDLLDAGHWVHVEAGEGVAQVLAARLG
jgi:pimeloyl-ACP methyl ester carboxylesterase